MRALKYRQAMPILDGEEVRQGEEEEEVAPGPACYRRGLLA